jgi:hypothetical protein
MQLVAWHANGLLDDEDIRGVYGDGYSPQGFWSILQGQYINQMPVAHQLLYGQ